MTSERTASSAPDIQFKVTLDDCKPPIWRRLVVPGGKNLHWLHSVIQVAFGWKDYHLYCFRIGDDEFGEPHDEYEMYGRRMRNSRGFRLATLLSRGITTFRYTYDFGDDWSHKIVVEKVTEADPALSFPRCIAGKRSGPPEDSGGPFGYEEKLLIARDPRDPEHAEIRDWLGRDFDPERFSVADVNARLKRVKPRRYLPD